MLNWNLQEGLRMVADQADPYSTACVSTRTLYASAERLDELERENAELRRHWGITCAVALIFIALYAFAPRTVRVPAPAPRCAADVLQLDPTEIRAAALPSVEL